MQTEGSIRGRFWGLGEKCLVTFRNLDGEEG